jgi:hypothetical protein
MATKKLGARQSRRSGVPKRRAHSVPKRKGHIEGFLWPRHFERPHRNAFH